VKKIKGLTLMETMIAVSLLAILVLGTATVFFQRAENMRAKQMGNDMALVMNAIDKKMQMDAYSTKSWSSEQWLNTNEFLEKLIGEELRTRDSACGKTNGWDAENSANPLALIPCERLSGDKLPFDLQAKANFSKESSTNGDFNISLFNIDYYFKDKASYDKNFGALVKAKKALDKFESAKNFTVHSYNWINRDNNQIITYENCLNINEKCGLRTQLEIYAGISTDKVRIDGKNDLMGEIDFDNGDTKCSKWEYQGGSWVSTPIKCTVKGGFDSDIDEVEAFINNTTISERVSLSKECTVENYQTSAQAEDGSTKNWLNTADIKTMPCGLTKEGTLITTAINTVNADIAISKDTIVSDAIINEAKSKEDVNVYGNAIIKTLNVEKSVKGNDVSATNEYKTNILDVKNSGVSSKYTTSLIAAFANTNAISTAVSQFQLVGIYNSFLGSTKVAGKTLINTRSAAFVNDASDPTVYSRSTGTVAGNVTVNDTATKRGKFYSGYTPESGDEGVADQNWNTLNINKIDDTTSTSVPKITGSTKSESVIRTEMAKPAATDLEVALYRDEKTFYSNTGSKLKAGKLGSDGVRFTGSTPATSTMPSGYSIDAESIFSRSTTTLKGSNPIVRVQRQGADKFVVQNGVMTINGDNLGDGNTTADLLITWPGAVEGAYPESGFRNKLYRNSIPSIINGTARFFGDVTQWKPLHMNSKYQGYDVCDRPNGVATACLSTAWYDLNSTQTILQRVQAEYDKLAAKLPPQKGDKGDTGEQGFKGDTGPDGLKGATGVRGPAGPMQYLKVNN
jgi:type II secretory pathway pseudopilin PulG